jgi:hypothetical protein
MRRRLAGAFLCYPAASVYTCSLNKFIFYLATAHHRNEHDNFEQVKCHEEERAASAARLSLPIWTER